ncbi:MAG TPA: helix-turn-helix transcriptional regulator [Armatimonadota bacterium]|jgi:AraC-like DNA-binding protein
MDESVLHSIFWNHLIYPELAAHELEDPSAILKWIDERLPGMKWPDYVVCLSVDGLDATDLAERRDAVARIRERVSQTLSPRQCALLGFAHSNALYFCGALDECREAFLERLSELNRRLHEECSLGNTIGIAFLREASLSGLQWAAQRSIVAQRQKVRTGGNRVYVHDASAPPDSLDLGAYWRLAQRMQAVVKAGDLPGAEAALREIAEALFQSTYLPLSHLRPILQCQVLFMAQAASDASLDAAEVARLSEDYLVRIGVAYDYARLRETLAEAGLRFTGMVRDHFQSVTHRLVAAVDECIASSLSDTDLCLHSIAARLGASPAHVSRTYKKAKGVGVTRSINAQRVETAKRALLDRNASVTSVAFDAGFGSLQHFGRVFREITGVTPTEFRAAKSGQSTAKSV